MSNKYLNLDAIDVPQGQVTVSGKEYTIQQLTMKQLINISTIEDRITDDVSGLESIFELVNEITGIPHDVLEGLSTSKLRAVVEFLTAISMPEEEESGDSKNDRQPEVAQPAQTDQKTPASTETVTLTKEPAML